MARMSEIETTRFNILLWGKANIGKTVLASQFPQPFFIDLDDGLGSVRALGKKHKLKFDFDVIQLDENVTEDKDFIDICGKVFAKQSTWIKTKQLVKKLCQRMPQDATLVVDNLSRLGEILIQHISKASGHMPLQIQDWGTFTLEITDLLNDMKDKSTKTNIILIGHEEYQTDKATDEIERLVLMPTKMRYRIPSIVSDSLYMKTLIRGPRQKREAIRFLQSVPDNVTATGSRALIPDIENPTYNKLRPFLEAAVNRKLPEPTWEIPS
jgi:hypothetical protein